MPGRVRTVNAEDLKGTARAGAQRVRRNGTAWRSVGVQLCI
jgi:hypothetical protein